MNSNLLNDYKVPQLNENGTYTLSQGQPISTPELATGWKAGAKAGFTNAADLVFPHLFDYQETGDWRAGIASGITNPVNIATAFLPVGIVAGALYGAVGDTLSDYLVKKQETGISDYSIANLGTEFAGGLVGGAILHGIVKGLSPAINKGAELIKPKQEITDVSSIVKPKVDVEPQQEITDVSSIVKPKVDVKPQQEITDVSSIVKPKVDVEPQPSIAQSPHIDDIDAIQMSDQAVSADKQLKNNAIPLNIDDNGAVIKTIKLDIPLPDSEIKNIIDNQITELHDIKELSAGANKYIETIPDKQLPDRMDNIRNADKNIKAYGNPENIASAFNNLTEIAKIRLTNLFKKSFTPEIKEFLSNAENKPELYNAFYGVSDNEIANQAAQLYQSLNKEITDKIKHYTDIGYLDNRFGRQTWDKDTLLKIGYDQWGKDLQLSGYKIKTSDGSILDVDNASAKHMYDNIVNSRDVGYGIPSKAKPRVLVTDNPAGAYAMEKVYGGDKNMLSVITDTISEGGTNIAKYNMFGSDIGGTLAEIGNITKHGELGGNIHLLSEAVQPTADASMDIAKDIVHKANLFFASAKLARVPISALYQVQFIPTDLVGTIGLSIAKYGKDIFTGILRGGFDELKSFSKYGELSHKDFTGIASNLRDGMMPTDGKFLQGISRITSKFDGSHLADKIIAKASFFLNAIGEREALIKGKEGSFGNIDPKIMKDAIGDGMLPDSDNLFKIIKDKQIKLNEAISNGAEKSAVDYLKKDIRKYTDAANEIDIKMLSARNDVLPLVYTKTSKLSKGSTENTLPFRMSRWVQNQWLGINFKMMKNIRNGNMAMRNATGLALYGIGIGLTETALDYMRNPADYNDEDHFRNELIKNTAAGILLGNLYIAAIITPPLIKHGAKSLYEYYNDNPEKAKKELEKSSAWYSVINAMSNHNE
jgi:hypothetical protein